jgi:hypothetical protein
MAQKKDTAPAGDEVVAELPEATIRLVEDGNLIFPLLTYEGPQPKEGDRVSIRHDGERYAVTVTSSERADGIVSARFQDGVKLD